MLSWSIWSDETHICWFSSSNKRNEMKMTVVVERLFVGGGGGAQHHDCIVVASCSTLTDKLCWIPRSLPIASKLVALDPLVTSACSRSWSIIVVLKDPVLLAPLYRYVCISAAAAPYCLSFLPVLFLTAALFPPTPSAARPPPLPPFCFSFCDFIHSFLQHSKWRREWERPTGSWACSLMFHGCCTMIHSPRSSALTPPLPWLTFHYNTHPKRVQSLIPKLLRRSTFAALVHKSFSPQKLV